MILTAYNKEKYKLGDWLEYMVCIDYYSNQELDESVGLISSNTYRKEVCI
jgi:hypothetical protein